jgi:hypothetical protein
VNIQEGNLHIRDGFIGRPANHISNVDAVTIPNVNMPAPSSPPPHSHAHRLNLYFQCVYFLIYTEILKQSEQQKRKKTGRRAEQSRPTPIESVSKPMLLGKRNQIYPNNVARAGSLALHRSDHLKMVSSIEAGKNTQKLWWYTLTR